MATFNSKKNNAASKIATVGGINASDNPVVFNVTTGDGSEFPSANFKILIDNEILLCTSRTGDALTCTRAQESTTAVAHSQNADVELTITAGDIEQIQTSVQNSAAIYVAATGSANAYAITLDPAPSAYVAGQLFCFKANFSNSGAATLNVNGLGAKTLKKASGTAFADVSSNDIITNMIVIAQYDGTDFQIKSQLSTSSGQTVIADESITTAKIANRTRYLWMPADAWDISEGSPTLTAGGIDVPTHWLFDDAAVESVITTFILPADYASGTIAIKCYFSMVSATSGNVTLHVRGIKIADGADTTVGGDSSEETTSVPGTAGLLKIYSFSGNFTAGAAGNLLKVCLRRIGNGAGDTAAGDLRFYGLRLEYTADS